MNKKFLLITLVFTMTICFIPFSPIKAVADSSAPVITSPVQYDEVDPYTALTITWTAPTSGNVSRYIVSVRELKVDGEETGTLIVNQRIIPSVTTSTTVDAASIVRRGYYRASVCAVLSDGTYHYSAERYFYSGITKGVQSGKCLSFKIYTGFTDGTKDAIYYASRAWINGIGAELINTYAYSQGVSSDSFNNSDGVNTITPYIDFDAAPMTTYTNWTYDYQTAEVDIRVNKNFLWSNNQTEDTLDIQNFITHEFGHAHGVVHKHEEYAESWTMYHEAGYEEISKRSLTEHDILSAKRLNGLT